MIRLTTLGLLATLAACGDESTSSAPPVSAERSPSAAPAPAPAPAAAHPTATAEPAVPAVDPSAPAADSSAVPQAAAAPANAAPTPATPSPVLPTPTSSTTAPPPSAPSTTLAAPGPAAAATAAPAASASEAPAATTPPALGAPAAPEAPALPAARTYVLDAKSSQLYVQVFKDPDTMAAGISHDHVISASGWSGEVSWDPSNPGACKVKIEVPVSKLVVDSPEMRKKVGYDGELSESQRGDVKSNMLASSQLNSASFSTISFLASKCEASGEKVKVSGSLSIRGASANVSSTMKLSADGSAFSASGTFSAKATDFGFQPYSAMMGALKNKNEMKFTVSVKGAAQ